MRMTRLAAIPAIVAVGLTAGCGGGNNSASSSSSSSSSTSAAASGSSSDNAGASSSASASGSSSASASGTQCPTDNTRAFAKTRFVADVGLAAGTFHRWIYKPYQAGAFKKGADGRMTAIAKAGATAALDAKLLSNAEKNVKASPALCKVLAQPLHDANEKLKGLKGQMLTGNFASIAAANTLFSQIENKSNSNGMQIKENTDESAAASAAAQN